MDESNEDDASSDEEDEDEDEEDEELQLYPLLLNVLRRYAEVLDTENLGGVLGGIAGVGEAFVPPSQLALLQLHRSKPAPSPSQRCPFRL